jgi:hypothetical protein
MKFSLSTVSVSSVAVLALSLGAVAQTARKPCEDLKAEITKKLDDKGVVNYSLEIVDKGKEPADAKIVGSCDGGTKSVVYSRGAAPAQTAKTDEKKPQ